MQAIFLWASLAICVAEDASLAAEPSAGADIYVAPGGDDGNMALCGSWTDSMASIVASRQARRSLDRKHAAADSSAAALWRAVLDAVRPGARESPTIARLQLDPRYRRMAFKHNEPAAIREYLQHADGFVGQCGAFIDGPLLTIDPVARKAYQHLDYRPLVNARAHPLGQRRQIVNDRLHAQYHQLLKILSYHRELDDPELMAVTYYLLLQDREDEALGTFARVRAERLATRLQYDYFAAYLAMFREQPQQARDIVAKSAWKG